MILLGIFELILLYGGQICNKVTKKQYICIFDVDKTLYVVV